jgi:hypothetical protein
VHRVRNKGMKDIYGSQWLNLEDGLSFRTHISMELLCEFKAEQEMLLLNKCLR